jgi:hypothetical protein
LNPSGEQTRVAYSNSALGQLVLTVTDADGVTLTHTRSISSSSP